MQYGIDEYFAASTSHQDALILYRELGDLLGQAKVLNNLGQVLSASSSPADACDHHVQALDIARALGTPLEEARALEGIGQSLLQRRYMNDAAVNLREALGIYQHLGTPDAQRVETVLAGHSFS